MKKFSRDFTSQVQSHLNKQPRCKERQGSVLSVEAVMIRVEGEVIQVEEPARRERERGVRIKNKGKQFQLIYSRSHMETDRLSTIVRQIDNKVIIVNKTPNKANNDVRQLLLSVASETQRPHLMMFQVSQQAAHPQAANFI